MTRSRELAELASAYDGGGSLSFRNRIINGDCRIDQRNNGASKSCTAGSITYVLDRWFVFPSGAALTAQQVSGSNTGTTNAFRLTGAAGSTACNFEQRIENLNIQDIAGQSVTVRVKVWCSSAVSNVQVYALSPTAVNNYASATASFSTAVTLNTGLNIVTVTGTLNASATNGQAVGIAFSSGIASGVTVEISEFQLEAGSVATPFERRPYGTELALCQRYYQVFGSVYAEGYASGAQVRQNFPISFPTQMRATPTRVVITTGSYTNIRSSSSAYAGLGINGLTNTWASCSMESSGSGYMAFSGQTESMSAEL